MSPKFGSFHILTIDFKPSPLTEFLVTKGGVLEDTFSSPWPRSLKSLALASKPQVLGLGLEALGPRKLPCPRLEDRTIF